MQASELIPALRSTLHPAARVLLVRSAPADAKSGLKLTLSGRAVAPLERVAELADELGFTLNSAPGYAAVAGDSPEVVVFDGTGAPDLERLRALRATPDMALVTIVALISDRTPAQGLSELQSAGAGAFLDAESSPLEVASRLQSAVELHRVRAENAQMREQLTRQMRVDDVTGVMTRRFFFQQAHRECARARRYGHPLSCLMIEVDHYRMLCATFTDAAGEGILRSVATILGQWTRDSDIIARFAEAKFVVLLPETDLDGATCAREKVQFALQEHAWRSEGRLMPVSVSIGESQLHQGQGPRAGVEYLSEGDEMGETALSTREAMAGLLEDSDAALSIARKGARVPEAFVPHTFVNEDVLILASQG